jgi:5-methylcytosine-specific restriction protein A
MTKPAGSPYKTARWQKERAEFLARPANRLCCCGCGKKAGTVDHKRAWKGNVTLFWDQRNWQAMAWRCHSRKTARGDGGFGRAPRIPGCDRDGMPKDPNDPWNLARRAAQRPL